MNHNDNMKKPNAYTLRIIGSSPNTLPLDRLALYLQEMSKLLGHSEKVHFDRLVKGSAAVRVWVEDSVAPEVRRRTRLAVAGSKEAPPEAVESLVRINSLLRQDGKRAQLKDPEGAVIYPFPGARQAAENPLIVDEDCSVVGQVIRIGGKDDTIPMLLKGTDGEDYRCSIRGTDLAKDIAAHYLSAPIEVSGKGRWRREVSGEWILERLQVRSFRELRDDWDEAFSMMSQLSSGWSAESDIDAKCAELRRG